MTTRQKPEVLIGRDEIVAAPAPRACVDQTLGLPGGLYVVMAMMFVGFISVLAMSFRGGHMVVAYAAILAFLVAFFTLPALFQRQKGLSWAMFRYKGIQTATGHASATEATILVLLLPFLILCFGIAIATIAAFT